MVALITETARLTARANCVEAGPAGARTTAVNVTSTVVDSHTAGGFKNCTGSRTDAAAMHDSSMHISAEEKNEGEDKGGVTSYFGMGSKL